jgi:hypothetical protein
MISADLIVYLSLSTLGIVTALAIWLRVRVEKKKKSGEKSELADLEMYKSDSSEVRQGGS